MSPLSLRGFEEAVAIRSFGSVFSMELPADSPAHQLAAELSAQIETALTELGMDAGELYHLSRADQLKLIEQTTDQTLHDQSLGELVSLIKTENVPQTFPQKSRSFDNGDAIDDKRADFKRRFSAGEISTKISPQKQARHVFNSREYAEYVTTFKKQGRPDLPSYIRPDFNQNDLERLVVTKLRGDVIVKKDGSFVEYVQCDEPIGYYYSPYKGKYIETSCAQVKYSLSGGNIHIIPVKDLLKGD